MENFTKSIVNAKTLDILTFSTVDYILFGSVLLISLAIGVYFGIFKKQNTPTKYLLGGKNMAVLPVAISLAASYTSAITLLGMPAEIYSYGTQYMTSLLPALVTAYISGKVFLPVFYDLQLTSSFEYLALRFDNKVRVTASFLCLIGYIFNIPLVMYVPAMAFNLVSGINIMYITPIVGFVCIFYTTIGGLKAVVWTDAVQFTLMNGAIFAIIILGISNEGGISNVWKIAEETDRIHFVDLNPSLYERSTFWSMSIGMAAMWIYGIGVNQMCIQRFLSVSSLRNATKVLLIYCVLILIIKGLSLFSGLIMVAKYNGCDPLKSGIITRADQILPYYVLDTTRNIPGLLGLFIAGIFSAALSTMSTILNTTCGVIYKDFLINVLPKDLSEQTAAKILKLLVFIVGTICMMLVFFMDKIGSILEIGISFDGMVSGAMVGIFSVGMLMPRANTKGTVAGALTSLFTMSFIMYKNKLAFANGDISYPKKPLTIDKCDIESFDNFSNLTTNVLAQNQNEVFFLYKISFMWYSLIGIIIMLVVTIPVSYLTNPPTRNQVKLEYFSPVIRRFLPKYITENPENKQNTSLLNENIEANINIEQFSNTG